MTKNKSELSLLPPRPGQCPVCAVKHDPGEPHDPTSFYYQFLFSVQWKRMPTWNDAMLHCSEEIRLKWLHYLHSIGIDANSLDVHGGIKTPEELQSRIEKSIDNSLT